MIILDTDALSHVKMKNADGILIESRLRISLDQEICTTSVNTYEMLNGTLALIERRKRERGDLVTAFHLFEELLNFLVNWKRPILPYDTASDQIYKGFPARLRQELGNDARIASVALYNNASVWTCNVNDFSKIPGLAVVDARTGSKVSSS